ncbi:MAG: ABC transporter permease [Acidobacteria bacterium]|nr:ABC transporter permease [Acidobacteriota bacterium]
MRAGRALASSLRAMGRFRLRTLAMAAGSFVGITALTVVVSAGGAAERRIQATGRHHFGESSILVMAGGAPLMSGPRGEAARLTLDDAEALAREAPGIESWDPQQVLPGAPVKRGDATATARVLGASERAPLVWSRGVTQGVFFDAAAVAQAARVAVIGETVARQLFGNEDPLDAEILVRNVPFRVIGVLEPFGTDIHGMDRDAEIVVPISTAMRRLLNVDTIVAIKLLVRDPSRVDEAAGEVRRILRERHGLAEGQKSDFSMVTAILVKKMVARVQRVLIVFLPLVAGISLLAGGAASAALMLASVSGRVSENGLRRAVGARAKDIGLQFLLETTLTTLAGGLAGLAVGGGLALYVIRRFHLEGGLSPLAVALGLGLSLAVGLLAGVLPARRGAALAPAAALR